jgi:hypothetical protein
LRVLDCCGRAAFEHHRARLSSGFAKKTTIYGQTVRHQGEKLADRRKTSSLIDIQISAHAIVYRVGF